jgi:hypothetical protein
MIHFNLLLKPITNTVESHELGNVYDEHLDNINSLLADLCDRLEDLNVLEFSVGGFGQANWRVDIRYDLLSFLEQIADVLEAISKKRRVDLSFPEQGMQRIIHIVPLNGSCKLSCSSFGNWTPSGELIEIESLELIQSFVSVTKTFFLASETYCPVLSRHDWFLEWKRRLDDLIDL